MESELAAPKTATSTQAAFETRFKAQFGDIDARFAAMANHISLTVNAISKLQETIAMMIAQQIAHDSRPSRRTGGPYKNVSARPLKASKRLEEADDDDSSTV